MKTIKLTAIGAMLMLAFSCAKHNLTPSGTRNDPPPTYQSPAKIIKPGGVRNDNPPTYLDPAKIIKPGGVRNDDPPKYTDPS